MGVNDKLTPTDVALGGKIWCDGCGGAWWLSGPQARAFLDSGEWPHLCGNNATVEVPGSREDCTDETELRFEPYDVDDAVARFKDAANRAKATGDDEAELHYRKAAAELPEQAARIRGEVS